MKENKKWISLGMKLSIMVFTVVMFSSMIIGTFSYVTFRSGTIAEHGEQALLVAQSVASAIDIESFKEISDTQVKTQYWYDVKEYIDKVKTITELDYLYIVEGYNSSDIRYFAEAIKPSDDYEPGDLGEEEDAVSFPDEFSVTLNTGAHTYTNIYDSSGYGFMVSGFSPIIDENNNVVGAVCADIFVEHVIDEVNSFGKKTMIVEIVCGMVFLFVSWLYIRNKVGKPITNIAHIAKNLAEGNLSFNKCDYSHYNDEIGVLYTNFDSVVTTLVRLINDINTMSDIHAAGDYEYKIDDTKYIGAYKEVVCGLTNMSFMYVNIFIEILDVLQNYGKGNFDVNIKDYPGKQKICNDTLNELQSNLIHVNEEINVLAENALSGNLKARADVEGFHGDWAKMISNLNNLIEAIVIPIQEASDVLSEIEKGNLSAKVKGNYKGDFSLIKDSLNKTSDELSDYIAEIRKVLKDVEENELRNKITKNFIGDFYAIKNSIDSIIDTQNILMHEILASARQVNIGANQISESSILLAQGASEQASTVQQLTTAITIIQEQTYKNAQSAEVADNLSLKSMENVSNATIEMKNLLQFINEIKDSSDSIAKIIKVIDDIAFQTNLLALNASVEAARAGEHGKGFAVVAEEVRNLSGRSHKAAEETQELIENTLNRINKGTKIAGTTSDALNKIVDNFKSVSNIVSDISLASKEQADSISDVSTGIKQISDVVQQIASSSEESASSATELSGQSESLNKLLSVFKLKEH